MDSIDDLLASENTVENIISEAKVHGVRCGGMGIQNQVNPIVADDVLSHIEEQSKAILTASLDTAENVNDESPDETPHDEQCPIAKQLEGLAVEKFAFQYIGKLEKEMERTLIDCQRFLCPERAAGMHKTNIQSFLALSKVGCGSLVFLPPCAYTICFMHT